MSMYDDFGLNNTIPKKNNSFKGFLFGCFKVIMLFVILSFLLTGFTNTLNMSSSGEEVDLSNIPAPTQYNTSGGTTIEINGGKANIAYVAEYSLSGRVVDVQNYKGSHIRNQLSPKDIGMVWGFLATDESQEKIFWSSAGNRFLYWRVPDGTWYSQIGGENAVTAHYSNNHLIPSDEATEKLIKKINKDDYVKIEGYLVNVNWKKDDGSYFYWNTSTSRNDDGDGACEVIYVTNVTWLK